MPRDLTQHSSYLQSVQRRYSEALRTLPDSSIEALGLLITEIDSIDPKETAPEKIRRCKALFSYRWALARLEQSLEPQELGRWQTRLAEVTISKALQVAWAEDKFQRTIPVKNRRPDGKVSGLFVLGLGKLGGYDLNFSSDVDLIAFYDSNILPVLESHGRTDVCVRVLKRMTQVLSSTENDNFVWRVDWRLRPDASVTQIAMSSRAALDFYFFRSLPWHRLAMIKARVIAGDLQAGKEFLAELSPYLWRQNLDYRAVDEVFLLKKKINQEHPQLKLSRIQESQGKADCEAFNLKLGAGGIREIEFIVNAMQLLWGGKKPALRVTSTLRALAELGEDGIIDPEMAEHLKQAYIFLRRVEDAVQMLENRQIHGLPGGGQLETLLKMLDFPDRTEFQRQLDQHREKVKSAFSGLFASQLPQEQESISDDPVPNWLNELEPRQQTAWNTWSNGFSNYAAEPGQYKKLRPLLRSFEDILSKPGINRVMAINRIDEFLRSIPTGGQYLRLLAEHPVLLKDILDPLIYSPHMSDLLQQSPHIVDYLLESTPDVRGSFDSDFVTQSSQFELKQERLRRFVNEHLYRSCLDLMRGEVGAIELQVYLTKLAEHVIQLAMTITNEEMGLESSPIAVVGLGKLGMGAMAPMSDLDLILVADNITDMEIAQKYSRRFQHLMETKTKEGRAYEMDMRLRPSGRSGPVTVSLESFSHYHMTRAKTWEHIALVAGRPVGGSESLQRAAERVRVSVLSKPRDLTQFKLDAAKMLSRLREQRIGKSGPEKVDVKLRSGGLMELDYLSACYCLMTSQPSENWTLSYDELVRRAWPGSEEVLRTATNFWRKLQVWSRVLRLDGKFLEDLPRHLLDPFLGDMEVDSVPELLAGMDRASEEVSLLLNKLMFEFEAEKSGDWKDWVETSVIWQ